MPRDIKYVLKYLSIKHTSRKATHIKLGTKYFVKHYLLYRARQGIILGLAVDCIDKSLLDCLLNCFVFGDDFYA